MTAYQQNPPQTRLHSSANISIMAYRICTEFKLHAPDFGRCAPSLTLIVGDAGTGKIFCIYGGLEKRPQSFARLHPLKSCHVRYTCSPHNASNVFEVTTFNETDEMARVTVSRNLVYIQGTDYLVEYLTARDFQVPAAQIYFRTGFASNRFQVPYSCSLQRQ